MGYITKVGNIFARLVLMVALAWAVIDGPDLFERIFGVDAGVHNATRALLGMQAAGNMVTGGAALLGGKGVMDSLRAKGIFGTAKTAAGKIGSFTGGAGGMAAGLGKGIADNHARYTAARNGQAVAGAVDSAVTGVASTAAANGVTEMPDRMEDFEASQAAEPVGGDNNSAGTSQQSGTERSGISGSESQDKQSPGKGSGDTNAAQTIGGYVGGRITKDFKQSGAAHSARRMYNLTYGSSIAHGDKRVARIEQQQQNSGSRSDPLQNAQPNKPQQESTVKNINEEDNPMQHETSWAEQEREHEQHQIEERGIEGK